MPSFSKVIPGFHPPRLAAMLVRTTTFRPSPLFTCSPQDYQINSANVKSRPWEVPHGGLSALPLSGKDDHCIGTGLQSGFGVRCNRRRMQKKSVNNLSTGINFNRPRKCYRENSVKRRNDPLTVCQGPRRFTSGSNPHCIRTWKRTSLTCQNAVVRTISPTFFMTWPGSISSFTKLSAAISTIPVTRRTMKCITIIKDIEA